MQIPKEVIEQATPYVIGGGSISLPTIIFCVGKWFHKRICTLEKRVEEKTSKTFADENLQTVKLCDERSGNIEKKLDTIDGKVSAIKLHLMKK